MEIANAVEAPLFQLGKTTEDEWKTIINRKAPWAELEVPHQISFVIPSTKLERIENVTKLMEYWKEMMGVANDFAAFDVRFIIICYLTFSLSCRNVY